MRRIFIGFAAAGLMVAGAAIGQQANGPAEGTQDVAPAGGLSTQPGITTEPTLCPDGSKPTLKEGEATGPTEPGAKLHYLCPDGSEITMGGGADPGETPTNIETPTMK